MVASARTCPATYCSQGSITGSWSLCGTSRIDDGEQPPPWLSAVDVLERKFLYLHVERFGPFLKRSQSTVSVTCARSKSCGRLKIPQGLTNWPHLPRQGWFTGRTQPVFKTVALRCVFYSSRRGLTLADNVITETGCVWEQNDEDCIWTIKRGNIIRTAAWYTSDSTASYH